MLFYPFAVIWFGLTTLLGEVVSKILLTVIYFVVLFPVSLIRQAMEKDTLDLKTFKKSWQIGDDYPQSPFHRQRHRTSLLNNLKIRIWNFYVNCGHFKSQEEIPVAALIIVLLVFGVLIVLSAGSAIAPFIYTLF